MEGRDSEILDSILDRLLTPPRSDSSKTLKEKIRTKLSEFHEDVATSEVRDRDGEIKLKAK